MHVTTSEKGPQLAVEIAGGKVTLEMTFPNHYDAIEWYEEIVLAGREHRHLVLDLQMGPPP